jgi:hypothetical protein
MLSSPRPPGRPWFPEQQRSTSTRPGRIILSPPEAASPPATVLHRTYSQTRRSPLRSPPRTVPTTPPSVRRIAALLEAADQQQRLVHGASVPLSLSPQVNAAALQRSTFARRTPSANHCGSGDVAPPRVHLQSTSRCIPEASLSLLVPVTVAAVAARSERDGAPRGLTTIGASAPAQPLEDAGARRRHCTAVT